MVRPCSSRPFSSAIALCASLAEAISTKPKPRERPVARSVTTAADSQAPICANRASRSAVVVSNERLPTKSFLPMDFSTLLHHSRWPAWSRLPGRESHRRTGRRRGRAQTKDASGPDEGALFSHRCQRGESETSTPGAASDCRVARGGSPWPRLRPSSPPAPPAAATAEWPLRRLCRRLPLILTRRAMGGTGTTPDPALQRAAELALLPPRLGAC